MFGLWKKRNTVLFLDLLLVNVNCAGKKHQEYSLMKTKCNKHFEQHAKQYWIMCYKRHTLHSQSPEAHRLENVCIIILPLSLGRHIVMWSYHIENISTIWTANANPWLLAQTNKCAAAQWFYTSILWWPVTVTRNSLPFSSWCTQGCFYLEFDDKKSSNISQRGESETRTSMFGGSYTKVWRNLHGLRV